MTALIIIAAIILFFTVLFMFSIRAELKYFGGKFDVTVKYMFFTVYPKKKKPKKEKNKAAKDKRSSEFIAYGEEIPDTPESDKTALSEEDKKLLEGDAKDKKGGKKGKDKEKKKVSLAARLEQGKILWESVNKPLKRLFRGIYINELVIDFTAGGEDAYAAGMNYGKMNAVVFNAISAVRFLFPVTVKTVDINVDFDLKKSVYDGGCSVRLRLGTALAVLLTAGIGILKNWGRLNAAGKDGDKEKKKPEKQTQSA